MLLTAFVSQAALAASPPVSNNEATAAATARAPASATVPPAATVPRSKAAPTVATSPQQKNLINRPANYLPKRSSLFVQIGDFNATQGTPQDIGIAGAIGDHFSVRSNNGRNILLGLGFYMDGLDRERFSLLYGVNAYYLGHTTVRGYVTEENMFTNLAYVYDIANYPIYAAAKLLLNTCSDDYVFAFDLGVGPNLIHTSNFSESSLDGGVTIPDNAYSGQTSVAFSATAGVGLRFTNAFGYVPLEIGYRFFYLGQGQLNKVNNQLSSSLDTGHNIANSIVLSFGF